VATATPTSGPIPLTVNFDGSGSSDPDGDPISFAWDLDGDGAWDDSTSATPTFTYSTAGTFTVGLKVLDGRVSSTTTLTITTNVALNRPGSASSIEMAGLEAGKAFDGNSTTRWSSQFSDPQWVMVDLGASFSISSVKLNWEAAFGRAYTIDVSPDALSWTTIFSTTTGDGGIDQLNGLSGTGRFVRMRGTVRGTVYGYSLWDFEVHGTPTNRPPTPTIATPQPTVTWAVNDVITFSGSATDPDDGTLPAAALFWELVLQHCPSNCHAHQLQSWTGVASGSFTAPDHDFPSYLELRLTATDSEGASTTTSVRIDPKTVVLSFQSVPSGLQIVVGQQSSATPFTVTVIQGSTNSISAPSPQTLGGVEYTFESWSDGGARAHDVVANTSTTYTATFR
jgi:PKD repeat protein